jgi:heterotetrameric sarcosine oxidase gamma subunit
VADASATPAAPAAPDRWPEIVARSPIRAQPPVRHHQGWEVSGAPGTGILDLVDLTPLTKVLVRAAPGSTAAAVLACPFGRTRHAPGALVVGAGPGEWLLLAPVATRPALIDELGQEGGPDDQGLTSVIDVTHGGFVIRLKGAYSNRVLEKLCAIDLAERATPDGSVFRSSVARITCTVIRDDVNGTRSYMLHGDRSAGQYLFDSVRDAGAEFSIGVAGYGDGP